MQKRCSWGIRLAVYCFFLVSATGALGQAQPAKELIEGAKKEGSLVWYTTVNLEQSQYFLKQFEKKHPFIKTELFRAVSNKILNKVIADKNAGKVFADVVSMGGFQSYFLKKKGLTVAYRSPEAEVVPAQFKDPEGYWVALYQNTSVIGYNTRLLNEKIVPREYSQLLEPQWKGKLGMDDSDEEWFANQCKIMGDDKCVNFLERLVGQNPKIIRGQNLLIQLMSAGEFPVAVIAYAGELENMKQRGAPVDWVGPSPVLSKIYPMAMIANAPHPNVAKLFIDFAFSKEGQTILRNFRRIPTRPDIEPDPPKLTKGLNIRAADLSLAEKFEDYARLWRKLIQG
ncbi:MAG: extracellular solute-binding protein [Deltaproteobacteria bacterium]|nr:extracellular solute-binding protein [Deltaproteobacteria bacterium]